MQQYLRRRAVLGVGVTAALVAVVIFSVGGTAPGEGIAAPSPSQSSRTSSPAPSATRPIPAPSATRPTPAPTAHASPEPTTAPELVALCPFTGEPLREGIELAPAPLLVSIDNHPASRPQSYLSAADVVIEATVQGNTTRLTALFACQEPAGAVGPVRSGRFYHIDLHHEFQAPVVVFGAAGYTIDRFDAAQTPYVDGSTVAILAFSRATDRQAPYNVYLDTTDFRELMTIGELSGVPVPEVPRSPWAFSAATSSFEGARSVSEVVIHTSAYWRFGWSFDHGNRQYTRIDGAVPGIDRATGETLQRGTVIVQLVSQERSFADPRAAADPPLHRLVGSGTGTVYADGSAVDVRWSRLTGDDPTTWTLAESGEPLVLPPGTVWWEIIPTSATISEG